MYLIYHRQTYFCTCNPVIKLLFSVSVFSSFRFKDVLSLSSRSIWDAYFLFVSESFRSRLFWNRIFLSFKFIFDYLNLSVALFILCDRTSSHCHTLWSCDPFKQNDYSFMIEKRNVCYNLLTNLKCKSKTIMINLHSKIKWYITKQI